MVIKLLCGEFFEYMETLIIKNCEDLKLHIKRRYFYKQFAGNYVINIVSENGEVKTDQKKIQFTSTICGDGRQYYDPTDVLWNEYEIHGVISRAKDYIQIFHEGSGELIFNNPFAFPVPSDIKSRTSVCLMWQTAILEVPTDDNILMQLWDLSKEVHDIKKQNEILLRCVEQLLPDD